MLDFFKRKKNQPDSENKNPQKPKDPALIASNSDSSLFQRLKRSLSRTRNHFTSKLFSIFSTHNALDGNAIEELESILLSADVGVAATEEILNTLKQKAKEEKLKEPTDFIKALETILFKIVEPYENPLSIAENTKPYVILMVGVNGSGKTTTIGKLANQLQAEGKKVLLAAGDTFRAAAIEQLKVWGERNTIPVIAQKIGADSAAVIFDAYQTAKAKGYDVLIADTAGRLHTQSHLMEELKKVVRILKKLDSDVPHEIMLVCDGTLGQNALNQAKVFFEAVQVSSIVVTKLDGTAKGGIIFNIAKTLKLPIRFIGVGENISDLKPFTAKAFVSALLDLGEENAEE